MVKKLVLVALLGIALVVSLSARADHESGKKGGHVVLTPDKLQWGPNPALPAGAVAALLDGDPSKAGGTFTVRVKMPDGYKVPPHWHPSDENVTVIQGALLIGTGEKFDAGKMEPVPAAGFMHMPKEMRHFAMAKGDTIIQVHGVGPFEINYLNPADDPRKK
jgi:hypothetical protein